MASLASSFRQVRCQKQLTNGLWQQQLAIRPRTTPKIDVRRMATSQQGLPSPSEATSLDEIPIPHSKVHYARQVPVSPSYFSREPKFNDLHIRLFAMLNRYHDLPRVRPADAPRVQWLKLELIRHQLGEPVKAALFSRVMKVAKRLNMIEPSMRPAEVDQALKELSQSVDTGESNKKPLTIDKHGRAVGVGRRKESNARAFVVEGNGEVFVNGKTLSSFFGRVHDRESAIWPLMVTKRLDKYNVWAIAKGGGTTGQAEALTMAIAAGLMAHEPALKNALRAGKLGLDSAIALSSRLTLLFSRMCHQRPQNGGEKEARSQEGSQDANLGQAIMRFALWLEELFWWSCIKPV